MINFLSFLPVSYTVFSRLKSKKELLSWVYLFPLFGAFSFLIYGDIYLIYIYPIIFINVISIYEIGYLYNDIYSTENELNPTVRVEKSWYEKNFYSLVLSRLVITIFTLAALYYLLPYNDFILFAISIVVLSFSFYMHNTIRGKLNVLTFSFLSFMKYTSLLITLHDQTLVFIVYLSFSLLRTLEYSAVKKHISSLSFILKSIDRSRVIYYIILLFFTVIMCQMSFFDCKYIYIPFYFFTYRTCLLLISKIYSIR